MKKREIATVALLLATTLLTGCGGQRQKDANEVADLTGTGEISQEMSVLGVSSEDKDFTSKLISGCYYVVHDGIYYPVVLHLDNFEDSASEYAQVVPERQMYFTTENEINIPTLYEGDELVYYSTTGLLDYMIWERYYDIGYTIGLNNISLMTSGRAWLDLANDDYDCIIPDSELFSIYDLGADAVMLHKIGGIPITEDLVQDGLIASTKKSSTYDLEVYNGTYYQHYNATANIHAFKAYELFASIEYEPMQEFLYKIEIPEYFVDGYYVINDTGMLRLVRGKSYSEASDFNEQLLFPAVEENDNPYGGAFENEEEEYVAPAMYSTYEPLNYFTTNIEGKLGYVPEEQEEPEVPEEEVREEVVLQEAIVKEVELFFPQGKNCKVSIKSKTGEITGDIRVIFEKSTYLVNYDRLAGVYETELPGNGQRGILKVTGLNSDYSITLTNAEQYNGQDITQEDAEESGDAEPAASTETAQAEEPAESDEAPRRR